MVSDPHVCIAPEAYSAHDSGEPAKAERAEKWTMLSECSVCRGGAQGIRKHWQQIEEEIAFYGFIMVYPMFHEFLACSPFCWGRFSTMTNIQKWKKHQNPWVLLELQPWNPHIVDPMVEAAFPACCSEKGMEKSSCGQFQTPMGIWHKDGNRME